MLKKNQYYGYDRTSDENNDSIHDGSEVNDEVDQYNMNQKHAASNKNDEDNYKNWVQWVHF